VTKTTAFRVKGSYEINRLLTGSGFFGYSHVTYVNGLRRDDDFLAGATLTYAFARNIGLTLDYRYTRVDSNLALASFDQNQVLVGATYKY
jgi:uncharacterized protein (PEP-CTERM system associated)